MMLDPKALEAAAEAEARYDGYDGLVSLSRGARDRYIERTREALQAYREEQSNARVVGAHKMVMAIRDIEEGNISSVHYKGQTWRPEPQWQDISTAPKEPWSKFLLWATFLAGAEVRLVTRDHIGRMMSYGCSQEGTHWMPLPQPPSALENCKSGLADANSKIPPHKEEG